MEIIILSCVRTVSIGFLNDQRRMNVALTRAREVLIVIGNAINLSRDQFWRSFLKNIASRNLYRCYQYDTLQKDFDFGNIVISDSWQPELSNEVDYL